MKHIEHDIQVAIHRLLSAYNILHFAVPNGGLRNIKTASYLKAEGTLAGVADLVLILPQRVVFVEVKTDKGKQSDSQKTFQECVSILGFEYLIWRNIDDCTRFIETLPQYVHKIKWSK